MNHDKIEQEIISSYKKLVGSATQKLSGIDVTIMRQGSSLTTYQQREMLTEVTPQEIQNVLFAIDSNIPPRIDRYNAYFFKKAWGIIKGNVIKAVQDYF